MVLHVRAGDRHRVRRGHDLRPIHHPRAGGVHRQQPGVLGVLRRSLADIGPAAGFCRLHDGEDAAHPVDRQAVLRDIGDEEAGGAGGGAFRVGDVLCEHGRAGGAFRAAVPGFSRHALFAAVLQPRNVRRGVPVRGAGVVRFCVDGVGRRVSLA